MCLQRVIGTKILQEDLFVYGVVELTKDGDKTPYRHEPIVADSNGLIYAKKDITIHALSHNITPNDTNYKAGFHRFPKKEQAEKRKSGNTQQTIRRYTIPKGTKITIGVEDEGYVIVTPILSLVKKENNNEFHKNICESRKQTVSQEV